MRRPAPPIRPNHVWHIDLMFVRIAEVWFYLVDIIDGFSRLLVHWRLVTTMHDWEVTLTVQEALEIHGLDGSSLSIVHDNGSQFVSREWRTLTKSVGITSIATRVQHPESNGLVERLHRTHRTEGPFAAEVAGIDIAVAEMTEYQSFYNFLRPHSALRYLTPADYHYGDPEQLLRQRAVGMARADAARREYWTAIAGNWPMTSVDGDRDAIYIPTAHQKDRAPLRSDPSAWLGRHTVEGQLFGAVPTQPVAIKATNLGGPGATPPDEQDLPSNRQADPLLSAQPDRVP